MPVFLPGECQGQRILVGYSPWGHYYMNNNIIILNCEIDIYVCVYVCVCVCVCVCVKLERQLSGVIKFRLWGLP